MTTALSDSVLSEGMRIGDSVRDPAKKSLSGIKELMIGTETGRTAYAALGVGKFLGHGDKLFAVPRITVIEPTD